MSKKNNKGKRQKYVQFLASQAQEETIRRKRKEDKKKVKSFANQMAKTLDMMNIGESGNVLNNSNVDIDDNVNMDLKYKRPKKASVYKKRHRNHYHKH